MPPIEPHAWAVTTDARCCSESRTALVHVERISGEPIRDMVNHPPHYTANPSGIEVIDVTEHLTFNAGNAVKYILRSPFKGAELEDLRKARWYVDREITRLETVEKRR